ncbi:Ankyrin repeat-containing domain protein [Beauveria brongniartii RCEF 3172]|uniref:Ankyrin repeat-containing domain protein n=1 Tax=Beauveria brongniartii RCEF 3172 TaxID=1081107 RepID=A0A166ZBD9_9HYPO|nr:Ankyrin repeat-containing domain protein [Beauveria brongniartii RCEF 3172]
MDPAHSHLWGELPRDTSDDNVDLVPHDTSHDWYSHLDDQEQTFEWCLRPVELEQDEPPAIPAHDAAAARLPTGTTNDGDAQLQPRRQGWDEFETTIKHLYLDEKKTIKQIVEFMQAQYGFYRSAKAYQNRLKQWRVHKNLNSSEMKLVLEIMNYRKHFEGKDTEFFVRGRLLPPHKIARFVSRNGDTASIGIPPGPSPPWLSYQTPRRTYSHGAYGRERSIHASSSATQGASSASFAPTGSGSHDWYMQSTTTNDPAAETRQNTANDTRRVLLMLTQEDKNDLAIFYGPVPETELRHGTDKLHRLLVAERARPTCPVSCCSYCGFLPGLVDVSIQGVSSLVSSTQQDLDMRTPSLIALLQFAIRHKEDAVLRHLVRRCQQSKFAQRIHRHLLCVALQYCRGALFRQLLLHGLDVNLDGTSSAGAGLLEQARMTLRDFTTKHVDLKGDNSSTFQAIGFMYRARVITERLWRDVVLWTALRHRRAGVLRACLQPPTSAKLDIDELMDKAAVICQVSKDTGSSEAAAVLVEPGSAVVSENGATVLHLATSLLLGDHVQRLLGRGADVNAAMKTGETALHILAASFSDGIDVAHSLLAWGASVVATDSVGDTALHKVAQQHAWASWRESLAALLVQAGADVNALNHRGETPLIVAARNQDLEAARVVMAWFVRKGAREDARDHDGNTAGVYLDARVRQHEAEVEEHDATGGAHGQGWDPLLCDWASGDAFPWTHWTAAEVAELRAARESSPRAELLRNRLVSFQLRT